MTSVQTNKTTDENISPALRQPTKRLESSADRELPVPAKPLPAAKSADSNIASSLKQCAATKAQSCVQTVWFSFFFDGTGNNLDADFESNKHSNVAKLYTVHKGDESSGSGTSVTKPENFGVYKVYIPGIGTYFPVKGDPGGSAAGLGAGAFGTERIEWAFEIFDEKMEKHVAKSKNPGNELVEINIAAFGFSRGAALARAFIHEFVESRCKKDGKGRLRFAKTGCHIRIRFLGIFDTVASVGLAMSANNMEKIDALKGDVRSHLSTRYDVHHDTRPENLAFAKNARPGADPAPGQYNGHISWGDTLKVPEVVEDVRHFVAGHEIRNSFPLDSICVLTKDGNFRMPDHFHEYVYPGVHSDVGGSYRPGEQGKSENSNSKLGLIPLRAMYDFAISAGTPLLPVSAWRQDHRADFDMSSAMQKDFGYYLAMIGTPATLGSAFNAHMKLFYGWKFRSIAKKLVGDKAERTSILRNETIFAREGRELNQMIARLKIAHGTAQAALAQANWNRDDYINGNSSSNMSLAALDEKVRRATQAEADARHKLLIQEAKLLALPRTSDLPETIDIYEKRLLKDAQSIYDIVHSPRQSTFRRGFITDATTLRPHYKIMLNAYVEQFIKDRGLSDARILGFFDSYVHDSLAGFGKDSTFPSDPRVIYVGDDEKMKYANNELNRNVDGDRAVV